MRHNVLTFDFLGQLEADERIANAHHLVDGACQHWGQTNESRTRTGEDDAADGAVRMVDVVHVQRIANTDDELRRGFTNDFLGFFETFVTGHILQTNLVFDAFRVFEGDAQRIGDGVGHVVGTGRHDAHIGGFSVIEHDHVGAVAVDVDHRFGLRLVGVAEQAGQRERTGVDGGDHETRAE